MKKLIMTLIILSFVGVCIAASIQDKHKAVIARRNVGGGAEAFYELSDDFADGTPWTKDSDSGTWTHTNGTVSYNAGDYGQYRFSADVLDNSYEQWIAVKMATYANYTGVFFRGTSGSGNRYWIYAGGDGNDDAYVETVSYSGSLISGITCTAGDNNFDDYVKPDDEDWIGYKVINTGTGATDFYIWDLGASAPTTGPSGWGAADYKCENPTINDLVNSGTSVGLAHYDSGTAVFGSANDAVIEFYAGSVTEP